MKPTLKYSPCLLVMLCVLIAMPCDACTNSLVFNCAGDKAVTCSDTWAFDPPSVTNLCSPAVVTAKVFSTVTNGLCPKFITRTWVMTNSCGCSNVCSQTVTIQSTNAITLLCAADKAVICSNAWSFDQPVVIGPCCTNMTFHFVDTTNGADCQHGQTITRQWDVTDCCLNTAFCTQRVELGISPTIVCCPPTNTTVSEGSPVSWEIPAAGSSLQYQYYLNGVPITDATNSIFSLPGILPKDAGTWNVTITNVFGSTNLSWYVAVIPCINLPCPESIIVQSCGGNTPVTYGANATQNCSGNPTVTFIPPSGTFFPVGATPVQCIATDDQGHTNSCVFTVTVICTDGGCCSNSFWELIPTATRPVARREHAMAYDDARGNVVLFGGYDTKGNRLNDTWVWDGSDWEMMSPVNRPSERSGHEMAYDAARQVVVLYGGLTASGASSETWEWNGQNWTLKTTPLGGPVARYRHSMAYDPSNHHVILYGGSGNGGTMGDTWAWNGGFWSEVANNGPSPRHSAAMATDPINNRVVLFGGSPQNDETWVWMGGTWAQASPGGPTPEARYEHAMAFSPGCGSVLLFGGINDQLGPLAGAWLWNGSGWAQASGSQPHPRLYPKLAMNSENAAVTLFGGYTANDAFDCAWQWSCFCQEAAPSDTNDFPILPAGLDPNSVDIVDVDQRMGTLDELYPEWDTSLATWYTNLHCSQAIGGYVPEDVLHPDEAADLAEIGISNVTVAEISAAVSNWSAAITAIATNQPTGLALAPPVGPPFTPPSQPHCVDPSLKYAFGGRDIIFIHGLKLDHVRDKIVNVRGADAVWQTTSQFPADSVNPEFYYPTGYFRSMAECNWNLTRNGGEPLIIDGVAASGHITRFLLDHGYMNRYLFVAYPCSQPLEVGVQAVLTQISDAMHFGTGVVDPSGKNDTSNFGTPSFVMIGHSTGGLVGDVALSAAAMHPNLMAEYIPRHCKTFLCYDVIISGSRLAAIGMAFSGLIDRPTQPWTCPLLNYALHQLGGSFACSPMPGEYDWDCSGIISGINNSILLDLVPEVTQARWASYERQNPVRIMTVSGGHPSNIKHLKYLLLPGLDDGVTTIDSAVGNPNPAATWPARIYINDPSHRAIYDKGIAKIRDQKHRAKGYYRDQVLDEDGAVAASGAVPYLSPTGMRPPAFTLDPDPALNPLNRYPNHFSFLQSASDHFGGYNGNPSFGGFNPNGPYYQDTDAKVPFTDTYFYQEHNDEESDVVFDPAVFQPYGMVYPGDDAPLISAESRLKNETWTRGKYWKWRKHGRKHWVFRRYYDLLPGWQGLMGCDYVYSTLLSSRAAQCPDCIKPPADTVLWLPFDEASGSTAHNFAGGSDGVRYNGSTIASGGNGPAPFLDYNLRVLRFDGVDDQVAVPSYPRINFGTNDFTIDAWIKRDANSGPDERMIVDKRDSETGIGYGLFMSQGKLVLILADSGGSFVYGDYAVVPTDGLWHFVAITVKRASQNGIRFYVDGLPTNITDPTQSSGSLDNNAPFRVGASAVPGRNPWLGSLDEVELFRRGLSAEEIHELALARWAGKCKLSCYVPASTSLCNSQTSVTNNVLICNRSLTTQSFNYHFEDCSTGSHLSFSPAAGTVLIQPGDCVTIPVRITVSGCCQSCYKLVAVAAGSGASFTSTGQLVYPDIGCGSGWGVSNPSVSVNSSAQAVLPPFRFVNTSGVTRIYSYRFAVLDPNGAFDSSHVSLNGLPPGTFVSGSVAVLPGATTNIFLSAQFVLPDPLGQYSVAMQMDPAGTGDWQSISTIGLNNVNLPSEKPPLTITVSGPNLVLNWNADGICHVQTATNVSGTAASWRDLPGLPPMLLPATMTNQFFRLRCP